MSLLRSLRLGVLLAAFLAPAALGASSAGAAFGIAPGSFFAKAHPTVPLLEVAPPFGEAYERREADIAALRAAPPFTQAGGHPDATASFSFDTDPSGELEDNVKDVGVSLPPGFIGNPTAVPACPRDSFTATVEQFYALVGGEHLGISNGCPVASQVGVASLTLREGGSKDFQAEVPVYRLTTAFGSPASFGMPVVGFGILLDPHLRSDGDYGLTVTASNVNGQLKTLVGSTLTFWGVPASPVHDPERFDLGTYGWGEGTQAEPRPFLSNASDCDSGPLDTALAADSWQQAALFLPTAPTDADYNSFSPSPTGCGALRFGGPAAPSSLTMQPTVRTADTPSGYEAKLTLPYNENPTGLGSPPLRKATVALPEGVAANASSANGLAACTETQIGYLGSGFAEPRPIRFDEAEPRCPDASKIGTVVVHTPLLEKALEGSVYLAAQDENPFGSLLAIYLAIDDPETGIVVKLAGEVTPDPRSGQLTASFTDNPQLPFTELDLSFFGGPGAALANPSTCGTKTTTSILTPWSAPYTPALTSTTSFAVSAGPNGSACASTEAGLPNRPGFEAGTVSPLAGAYSPFVLKLSREDGSQRIGRIDATLPLGLLGRLAGIPYCPEAAISAAAGRSRPGEGSLELGAPSCPAASLVGTVDITAGAGTQPVHVQGKAYLAGPYEGAPLSLEIITPALAGPFDLGTVAVRTALHIDEATTQIHAVSDQIPSILAGVPLDVRSVAVNLDKPEFTLNPTSCDATEVLGALTSTLGQVASLTDRFQLGGCGGLAFEPGLTLKLSGRTRRAGNPALKAVLTQPTGQSANVAKVQVMLPRSVFIDQGHVGNPCTRVQFGEGAGNGSACPPKSILGKATAYSPLLAEPLTGYVYFRSNGGERKLPDLVASLGGQIHLNLVGFIDSVHKKGVEGSRVRTTFASVPDAPVSRFVLELQGGKKGLLVNSTNLCRSTNKATVKMDGQNGKVHDFETVVKPSCGSKSKTKRPKKK